MNDFLMEVQKVVDQLIQGHASGDEEVINWVKRAKTIESVERIPGDASTRQYYRIKARPAPGSTESNSYMLMRMDAPFTEQAEKFPFLVVQEHLKTAGVDVPAVLDMDAARGFILLEDLGDVTLLRQLQEVCNADIERHWYERVIDSLVDFHVKASPARKPADIDGYKLRFDHEKLMWEMNFTLEHFYDKYMGRKITADDRKTILNGLSEICQILADEPTVFTHRDFHSRNVMVTQDNRLVMIDFQDARMGPMQYDLASLLKDSYYQLEEAQISRLLDYYVIRWEALTGEKLDREHFRYIFDLMSVQRNFKAIGSFASFLNRRGNPAYLKFIGNTFENVRRTLLKYPQYSKLRETLFHYYYF